MGGCRLVSVTIAALVCALASATHVHATFHEISIREVYPGAALAPDSDYVELQMHAGGQQFVDGQSLRVYDAAGAPDGTFTFGANVGNGGTQRTILIGDEGVDDAFGIAPDLVDASFALDSAGGAACWANTIDCVSWGAFADSTPSPAGSPADPSGIPDGMALRRTIAPGCSTLLEHNDDSDDSAADFADASPAPRPNSAAPSERACPSQGGAGGPGLPGAGGGEGPPQTTLRRRPAKSTRDRTPTFSFTANRRGVAFLCKLDRRPYKRCRSPYTSSRLLPGPHVFRVKARVLGGGADRSPAVWRFEIVRGG